MNVYARVRITIKGTEATFALVNCRHTGKTSDFYNYGWILESGPQWAAEFAPEPLVDLADIPVWADKTCLV